MSRDSDSVDSQQAVVRARHAIGSRPTDATSVSRRHDTAVVVRSHGIHDAVAVDPSGVAR